MKTGNLEKKIYVERDTEVGIVAKFFNHLLGQLRVKNEKLTSSNKNLRQKAYNDALTGIFNRRGLLKYIKTKLLEYKYSIVIIDIDNFKQVNDTYGHDAGDEVLKHLANRISKNIRKTDVIARWGGEEFVLLVKSSELEIVQIIAEKLRMDIEKEKFPVVEKITASFGVSNFKNRNQSFEDVFKNADNALYQAKENGRNKVFVF